VRWKKEDGFVFGGGKGVLRIRKRAIRQLLPREAKRIWKRLSVKGGREVKLRWCVWVFVFLFAWLPATGKLAAAESAKDPKDKKEVIKPAKNSVPVYTSSRVWIGLLDKDAELEVILVAGQWCKVQYTKDGTHFVGWVRKDDVILPEGISPENDQETKPKILTLQETSDQLRQLVRVGVDYQSSRGEGWDPKVTVGVTPARRGNVQMKLRTDGKGMPAKMLVLARFRRDKVIELYVEQKIVELKQFRQVANPGFYRVIDSYVRALEAYNDNRIPDFKRLIDSAESFWDTIDNQPK
jgi:hypothetical protein